MAEPFTLEHDNVIGVIGDTALVKNEQTGNYLLVGDRHSASLRFNIGDEHALREFVEFLDEERLTEKFWEGYRNGETAGYTNGWHQGRNDNFL